MNAEATEHRRSFRGTAARRLGLIGVLFCFAVIAVLVSDRIREGDNRWLESARVAELREQLQADPTSEALKQEIREYDRFLRARYHAFRRRNAIAGILLLAGAVWTLVWVRLAQVEEGRPRPDLPPGR